MFRHGKPEQLITAIANTHPLKRIGTVDEIASVVAFLASPEAAWVNGQDILINGVSGYVFIWRSCIDIVVNLGFRRLIVLSRTINEFNDQIEISDNCSFSRHKINVTLVHSLGCLSAVHEVLDFESFERFDVHGADHIVDEHALRATNATID